MTLCCITNDMDDVRSCTIRDEHSSGCDGCAYRWNSTKNEREDSGRPCTGCLPQPAKHGLLCWGCWERVEHALTAWPAFAVIIASIDRAVVHDNGGIGGSSEGYVPIPGTRLAVDECESYLRTLTGPADAWVARWDGAVDAVRFARAAESAFRTHAIEEKPHRIKRTRCTKCNQLTLIWNPPQYAHDLVRVTCQNKECLLELDQRSFEKVAEIEEGPKRKKVSA